MAENEIGTLEAIGLEVVKVFVPFKERVEAGEMLLLLAELGIEFPASLANDTDFQGAVTGVANKVNTLVGVSSAMIAAIKAEDYALSGEKAVELAQLIAAMVDDFQTIADEINANGPYPGLSPSELSDYVQDLAVNLVEYLLINYLKSTVSLFVLFLEFFGIVEETVQNEGSVNPLKPEYIKSDFRFDRIGDFFKDPMGLAQELYGWGGNDEEGNPFTGEKLFKKLEKIIAAMGWPAVYDESTGQPALDILLLRFKPRTDLNPRGLEMTIDEPITGGLSQTFTFGKSSLEVAFNSGLGVDTSLVAQPNGTFTITPPAASSLEVTGEASAKWIAKDPTGTPLVIFGNTNASRLESKEISALFKAGFNWDGSKADVDVTVEAAVEEGKIIIKPANPDGFLAQILPEDGIVVSFDILMGIDSDRGFYFEGSGGLKIALALNLQLGPLAINTLTLSIEAGSEGIPIGIGANIGLELGPFVAVVEEMGIKANFTFPDDKKGNLGVANLDIDFKPPTGIGLSLDASVVKGGGYLFFDPDNEQYGGALELVIADKISVVAIGLITTRFPDGSKGFSLLLLISVEFSPGIALGMGFFLSGLGGMIGINRTINTDALREGVKQGSVDHILFPTDVVANIQRIITDLREFFPPQRDQFIIGLMAKITWGVPTLLSVEFGLAVEFASPVRIAILGVIKLVLPTEDEAILRIQVNFIGIIDFEEGYLSFDASLFGSKILTFTLEGDMALRIFWGKQKEFLMSVGGFHPSFSPPAFLRVGNMSRLTLNILSGNPRLTLSTYFAVTSNTVQFGAEIDFYFSVSKFKVIGYFGFDVLFQFSPFRFIASIRAGVEVKLGSSTLFSIKLAFELQGPTPWIANGTASFKILFISIDVKFSHTWGERREDTLPNIAVLPKVMEALEQSRNWIGELPANRFLLTTIKTIELEEGQVLMHAVGTLTVKQNIVPVGLDLDKFGNYQPQDIKKVEFTEISINNDTVEFDLIKDAFAPAEFIDMEDADKLSSPSYKDENSGVKVKATESLHMNYGINRLVEYELRVSDYDRSSDVDYALYQPIADRFKDEKSLFRKMAKGGAIGQSELSKTLANNNFKNANEVVLEEERFTVANMDTLERVELDGFTGGSKAEANTYLKTLITNNPKLKKQVQIVPEYELV